MIARLFALIAAWVSARLGGSGRAAQNDGYWGGVTMRDREQP